MGDWIKPYIVLHGGMGIDVMLLTGEIDHHEGVPRLEKTFADLKARGATKVILDFHDVTYCCSGGIAVILDAAEEMKGQNGTLVCAAVSGPPREPMDLLDIPDVVPFFDSTAEAFEALENDTGKPAALS